MGRGLVWVRASSLSGLTVELYRSLTIRKHIKLCRKGQLVEVFFLILVTFDMGETEASSDMMRPAKHSEEIGIVWKSTFGYAVSYQHYIADSTFAVDIELEDAVNVDVVKRGEFVEVRSQGRNCRFFTA